MNTTQKRINATTSLLDNGAKLFADVAFSEATQDSLAFRVHLILTKNLPRYSFLQEALKLTSKQKVLVSYD